MNEQKKTMTQETQNREDFIMLPTVDFCFKSRAGRDRRNYFTADNLTSRISG